MKNDSNFNIFGGSWRAWCLPLVGLAAVAACDTDTEEAPPPPPTTSGASCVEDDALEIFARNGCTACHTADPGPVGGELDLVSSGLADRTVGRTSFNPSCSEDVIVSLERPEESLLLRLVAPKRYAGHGSASCEAPTMPLASDERLSTSDVDCLETWIQSLEEDDLDPDIPEPAPALAVVTKAKYILHGGAPTAEELARVEAEDGTADPAALEELVGEWMATDSFRVKRRQFLELTLQQSPSDGNYFTQYRNTKNAGMRGVRESLRNSLLRTAERIVDDEEDFRTIVTTNEWEVTTLTLLALKMADNPMVLNSRGVWPKGNSINDIRHVVNNGLYDKDADASDWRTIRLVHDPLSNHMTTEADFEDAAAVEYLRGIPDGGEVTLRAPRVGFFTSPAFFQTWLTNFDNNFRVTIGQALIVAVGSTFSPGDTTAHNTNLEAVDLEVFPQDSECYGCHQNIEPMREAFLRHYDPVNTRYQPDSGEGLAADFVFQGHSVPVDDLHDWADALASHPNFARGWVLKVCEWASSIACDPNDPVVQALADDFVSSGYNLTYLFQRLFSSPILTHTSFREATKVPGGQVTLARQGHFCQAAKVRLEDAQVAQDQPPTDDADICRESDLTRLLSGSIPEDAAPRGTARFHQPTSFDAMNAMTFEGLCGAAASDVVGRVFPEDDPEQTLDLFVSHVLGLPGGPRATEARAALKRIYDVHIAEPACSGAGDLDAALRGDEAASCGLGATSEEALQSVWTMVCQSPSLTGVGL